MIAWRPSAVPTLLSLGQRERTMELADEEVTLARGFGAPRSPGVALRAKALVAGGEHGLSLLGEAVQILETSSAALERARALVDLGAAHRRVGRKVLGLEYLRLGLDLADRCRAVVLAERARRELRAAGARSRRPTYSGIDSLSPSERRVSELAAGGMSNREAAQALCVTEKTIEAHLTSIYRGLLIRSRVHLARLMARTESTHP